MMIIKYLLLALFGVLVSLFAWVFSPVLALFIRSDGYLPGWLSWFQTQDNPAIGDAGFQTRQMSWTTSRYLWGMFWIARNPAYGYDSWAGFDVSPDMIYMTSKLAGLEWDNTATVFRTGTMLQTFGKYFEWSAVWRWSATRYGRVAFGWHLNPPFVIGERRGLRLTVSPYMMIQKPPAVQ